MSVKGSCIFFNLCLHNVYMLFKNKDVFNIGPEYTNRVNFFMSMNHALLDDRTKITNVEWTGRYRINTQSIDHDYTSFYRVSCRGVFFFSIKASNWSVPSLSHFVFKCFMTFTAYSAFTLGLCLWGYMLNSPFSGKFMEFTVS